MNRSGISLTARMMIAIAVFPILLGCFSLEFSPDGRRLLFMWADSSNPSKTTIATSNSDGSGMRIIPNSKDSAFGHWSPDGKQIAFAAEMGLWIYDCEVGTSKSVFKGDVGQSVWTSNDEIAFLVERGDGENKIVKIKWLNLKQGTIRQETTVFKGAASLAPDISGAMAHLVPIPRTDGVLTLIQENLVLAEFGEGREITTTGGVVGFALHKDGNRVIFARRSNNAQYILLSLYEYDLQLRSVKRLPFPDHVPNVNPAPRRGPKEVITVKFSADLQHMLVFTLRDQISASRAGIFDALYWVDIAGSQGRKVVVVDPSNNGQGLMAAISPDSKTVAALYETKDSITLASYPVDGGPKKILQRTATTKK